MDDITKIILVVAPIAFIAIWSLVVAFIGLAGGWYSLAKKLEKHDDLGFKTMDFTMSSLSLGLFAKYNGVINIYIYENGFVCTPILFFRIIHPPIIIMWDDIQSATVGNSIFNNFLDISIKNNKIRFFGKVANYLYIQYNMDKNG